MGGYAILILAASTAAVMATATATATTAAASSSLLSSSPDRSAFAPRRADGASDAASSSSAAAAAAAASAPWDVPQTEIRDFAVLTSAEIASRLHDLADAYPQFSTLTSAQEEWDLTAAGTERDCPHDHEGGYNGGYDGGVITAGCKNWILTIEDKVANPVGSDVWRELPEVFLSGALHGNERVGPTAVTETAELLLESAACEALPRRAEAMTLSPRRGEGGEEERGPSEEELDKARECRLSLARRGVSSVHRRWLARLVATRRVVIVPTANALGYHQDRREEDGVDPNRDFPYDLKDDRLCMQTIAGRTINELFRRHIFQLSLTFHAGMETVAYEWGAPTYLHKTSPDDVAQAEIADGYSRYGGGWNGKFKSPQYQTGTMNDVVYYVRGGMEDWAYAGSWDPDRVIKCNPKQHGGYDGERNVYDETTLRVFNMLVEASDHKTPRAGSLGTTEDLFNGDTDGNGHISRNIRLSLLAIDLVQPYAFLLGVNGVALADDVVPGVPPTQQERRACAQDKAVTFPADKGEISVAWTAGGGFSVDETFIFHARWNDLPGSVNCATRLTEEELASLESRLTKSDVSSGRTQWHAKGPEPAAHSSGPYGGFQGSFFESAVDVSRYKPGDVVAVFAVVKMDQGWAEQPLKKGGSPIGPPGPPRSHAANARTDPTWNMQQIESGKVVHGQRLWYSVPLTIVVGPPVVGGTDEEQQGRDNGVADRFSGAYPAIPPGKLEAWNPQTRNGFGGSSVTIMLLMFVVVACMAVRWAKRSRNAGQPLKTAPEEWDDSASVDPDEVGDEEGFMGRGMYSDDPGVELPQID